MDLAEAFIPIGILACIFGIFYLYFITRHRERLALIEKGEDASLFHPEGSSINQVRTMIILNIALTLIGIGVGITIGILLYELTGKSAVYPASIFIMTGVSLLASMFIGKKMTAE